MSNKQQSIINKLIQIAQNNGKLSTEIVCSYALNSNTKIGLITKENAQARKQWEKKPSSPIKLIEDLIYYYI